MLMRLLLCLLTLLCLPLAKAADSAPSLDLAALRGRVVLVDFWASWCTPCLASWPWLSDVQQRHGNDGLTVITVNLDEDPAALQHFLKRYPSSLPVVRDPTGALAAQWQLQTMPSSLLFDRQGTLRYRHNGFLQADISRYEDHLRTLLRE